MKLACKCSKGQKNISNKNPLKKKELKKSLQHANFKQTCFEFKPKKKGLTAKAICYPFPLSESEKEESGAYMGREAHGPG